MAKGKRVALCLPSHIDEPITKLSKITNSPKTAIITDILENVAPQMNLVIEAIESAKENQQAAAMGVLDEFMARAALQLAQAELELVTLRKGIKHAEKY